MQLFIFLIAVDGIHEFHQPLLFISNNWPIYQLPRMDNDNPQAQPKFL